MPWCKAAIHAQDEAKFPSDAVTYYRVIFLSKSWLYLAYAPLILKVLAKKN